MLQIIGELVDIVTFLSQELNEALGSAGKKLEIDTVNTADCRESNIM